MAAIEQPPARTPERALDSLALDSLALKSIALESIALESLTHESSAASIAAARELLLEYGHFVLAQPSVASFCFGALEQEADALPGSYLAKEGGALLATRGETTGRNAQAIGFVAWRTLPTLSGAWELKRLWTRPEARGLGLGRTLVQAVIDRARAAGKSSLVLDTEPGAMAAAYDLYGKMGFAPCPSYSGVSIPGIVYMRKFL